MYSEEVRRAALGLLDTGRSLNSVSLELGAQPVRDPRVAGTGGSAEPASPGDLLLPGSSASAAPTLAYPALFGFYLGDGCISRTARTYALRVSCDQKQPGTIPGRRGLPVTRFTEMAGWVGCRHPDASSSRATGTAGRACTPRRGTGPEGPAQVDHGPVAAGDPVETYPDGLPARLVPLRRKPLTPTGRGVPVAGVDEALRLPALAVHELLRRDPGLVLRSTGPDRGAWRQSNWKTISVSTRAGVAKLDELIGLKR